MAEPKDGEGFFRKVVRFVANPATDWTDLAARQDDRQDFDVEKSEIKAMVERKRRNDFVRKREFDMLRKLRREGLSPEQLAALCGSSRLDDSEARLSDPVARADTGVKAKIDQIEQQMEGEGFRTTARRSTGFSNAPTLPAAFQSATPDSGAAAFDDGERLPALPPLPEIDMPLAPPSAPAPVVMGVGMAPLRGAASAAATDAAAPRPDAVRQDYGNSMLAVEVSEVVHDPELDEAVIAFANADFNHSEQAILQLCGAGAPRYRHAETWRVLFDLYRATGQQLRFESLALDYANLFGSSAPQWYSLPKLVADAAAAAERPASAARAAGQVGWVCGATLDVDAMARLHSATLQLPLPWVLDWSALENIEPEAAAQLTTLLRQWAGQRVDMRWLAGDHLLATLQEAAPAGVRDADPAYWMARLEALRLANRPDQFDEAAIDYCVTYEVSPPSWERALCSVRSTSATQSTMTPPMSHVSEVSTGFLESSLIDATEPGQQVASVELSGQLVGDIAATLARIDQQLGLAPLISVSCVRLIRVDFIAAGDLLNWVLVKRSQNRNVTFTEAHRLVGLFFGAMGINEHARVQVLRD